MRLDPGTARSFLDGRLSRRSRGFGGGCCGRGTGFGDSAGFDGLNGSQHRLGGTRNRAEGFIEPAHGFNELRSSGFRVAGAGSGELAGDSNDSFTDLYAWRQLL